MRPEPEHRIDEASAAAALFDRLARAAQRALFELQQATPDYVPRLPSAEQVALAASQLMTDPGLQIRLALLAGSFFEAAPPPALLPVATPATPVTPPAHGVAEAEEETEAPEASGEPEPGAETLAEGEEGDDATATDDGTTAAVQAKISKLIGSITGRTWGPAEAAVRHLPPSIKDHWARVLRQARTANEVISTITHTNLDRAAAIAAEIDCLPVREAIDGRIASLRRGLPPLEPPPPPEPPARRSLGLRLPTPPGASDTVARRPQPAEPVGPAAAPDETAPARPTRRAIGRTPGDR